MKEKKTLSQSVQVQVCKDIQNSLKLEQSKRKKAIQPRWPLNSICRLKTEHSFGEIMVVSTDGLLKTFVIRGHFTYYSGNLDD